MTQPSSQTLRERIQECLDADGSKTWRAELLEECLAALAAQEASPQPDLARAIGKAHGDGQESTIADVNTGRIDDLIQPRLDAIAREWFEKGWQARDNAPVGKCPDGAIDHHYLAACRQEQP